jgi:hypothetical protein
LIATLIIIVIAALLAATALTVYRRQQKLLEGRAQRELKQRPPRSLFADTQEALDASARALPPQPAHSYMEQRAAFVARAAADDLTALVDAHQTNDAALYRVVLHELVERAARSDEKLRALVSFIKGRTDLRGSVELAEVYSAVWQETPDRATTATMLHLAALSDDPDTFRKAAEITSLFWQNEQLPQLTGAELRTLIDSEYWVLSSDARRTGAGFVLKQRLEGLRHELAEQIAPAVQADEPAAQPDGI